MLCQHCSSYQSSFSHALTAVSALLANSSGGGSGEYLCLFPAAVLTARYQYTTSMVQCLLGFTAASDRALLCCQKKHNNCAANMGKYSWQLTSQTGSSGVCDYQAVPKVYLYTSIAGVEDLLDFLSSFV